MLIQRGNVKLGVQTLAFSLPAGLSCPGETDICASCCYATKRFFKTHIVRKSLADNMHASAQPDFVTRVLGELDHHLSSVVRIHVSGDFYNAEYVHKWILIAKRRPNTVFYAYTRSWRIQRMLPALLKFAELPNVQLWWSVDKDTDQLDGAPPAHPSIRVAYMQAEHGEAIPEYTNLVFRVKRNTLEKFIDGRLVCLAENGMKYPKRKMTCTRCKLCAVQRAIPCKQKTVKRSTDLLSLSTQSRCVRS